MSKTLYAYYERELRFIRRLAQDFAQQYPAAAGRLLLEPNRSADPHVERMIESFALLAGRVHQKLDDEFPELTDALLNTLYPHYLAPIPSMAIVQFELDASRARLPGGFTIDKGNQLVTQPVGEIPCKFRTAYPVTLWPVRLTEARLSPPPFPAGLETPPKAAAALRLRLDCLAGLRFADLSLDRLRFYLDGDGPTTAALYEAIFNHTIRVVIRPATPDPRWPPLTLSPDECLGQVGFDRDEGMLPYPNQSFLGYRLLTEFFAFPSKFYFFDLTGLAALSTASYPDKIEVILYLDRTSPTLEQGVNLDTFRLGCTPIVNLFEQTAEPIALTQAQFQYRVVPDVAHPLGLEVHSVNAVRSTDPVARTTTDYQPFYSFRHAPERRDNQAFWYASREPSLREDDVGTEIYLNLVDLGFNPNLPADSTLVVWTTCTNRDLPTRLEHLGDRLALWLVTAAPITGVRCLRSPTRPIRPPLRRGAHWRLISHLNLNYLSLADSEEGLAALQEILRLYDFSDPEESGPTASINRQLIEGLTSLRSRRAVARSSDQDEVGICRGTEITIEFDEEKYVGTGVYLFASVLERFLGLYCSINSFTRLVATTKQDGRPFKTWPARAGYHVIV
ncbi:type VI secretion system baseplate subunit TssF [Singulisphaera sp. Ch08]|uniref:Type VI secretion system baseplate subunit TssF n=1 Tax=Singulisphaera sp. Ch08 TaxID=3120278 RepID=A0AAU7CC81_9BACT